MHHGSLCMIAEVSLVGWGGPPGSVSPLIDGNTTTCMKPFSDQVMFEAEIHRLSEPIATNFTVKILARNSHSCMEDYHLVIYKVNNCDNYYMSCAFLKGREMNGVLTCYHQCQTSQVYIRLQWQFVSFLEYDKTMDICEVCLQ